MYKLATGGVIHPNGFFIPDNPLNADWQDFLAFIQAGGVAQPADPPPPPTEGDLAKGGAKQWFIANAPAQALFTLSVDELVAEVDSLDLAALPAATRNKLKLLLKTLAVMVRVLAKRELG